MAVQKKCGCKDKTKCRHPWRLEHMLQGKRYRVAVNKFALARGATQRVSSKQEAKNWDRRFIEEILAGRDPAKPPEPQRQSLASATVATLLDEYLRDHVAPAPLRSKRSKESACRALKTVIGAGLVQDLETTRPAEAVRAHFKKLGRAVATVNRYLAELRFVTNWAIGRGDLSRSGFGRYGVRISPKDENQRTRRLRDGEEEALLFACDSLDQGRPGAGPHALERARIIRQRVASGETQAALAKEYGLSTGYVSQVVGEKILPERLENPPTAGREMRDRIVGALELCCRKGSLLAIQNRHVDWLAREVEFPKAHEKGKRARRISFAGSERLTEIFERRRQLGPDAFVFGEWHTGARVKDFSRAWTSVVLLAHGVTPKYKGRNQKLTDECRERLAEIDLHFHDLRHEALSRYGEGGMLLRELQVLAGHQDPKTTTRYEHVDRERLGDSMARARRTRLERMAQRASKAS